MEIPVEHIITDGKRSERDYGDLRSLCRSLEELGQLQEILVTPVPDSDPQKYLLVIGGRRVAAFKKMGIKKIRATTKENMDEVLRKEYELAENLERKNLSPIEKQRHLRDLFLLKQKLYNENTTILGRRRYTQSQFAEEQGISQGEVSTAIKIAEASDKYSEVEGCKTVLEAKKKIRRLEIEHKTSTNYRINPILLEDAITELLSFDKRYRLIYFNYLPGQENLVDVAESLLSQYGTLVIEPVEEPPNHAISSLKPTILQETGKGEYKELFFLCHLRDNPFENQVLTFERSYDYHLPNSHGPNFWERILRKIMRDTENKNILFINPMDFSMSDFTFINNWKVDYVFTESVYYKQMKAHIGETDNQGKN